MTSIRTEILLGLRHIDYMEIQPEYASADFMRACCELIVAGYAEDDEHNRLRLTPAGCFAADWEGR